MTLRAACASTAFLTATTWAAVDATSYSASEAVATNATTTAATSRSSGFTPGAITVDGIAIKLGTRIGTTGTITVRLWNNTDSTNDAGETCTINVSDLPPSQSLITVLDGGWIFFKWAAPVTLTAAKSYMVEAFTSNSSQVSIFATATTNWSRYLRTTTTGAPVAGDDLIITKEWTAAATGTALSITMDETAATDYGSAPSAANGLLTPGIAICQGGTLVYGTTAATNYLLQLSNSLIVYNGGELDIGTTGTPVPRDGSAILQFDLAADGDYGLVARNGSIVNMQGQSRTVGKNVISCKMTADAAASGGAPSTSTLSVDTDTGWLSTDIIAVASTSRTASDCEFGTLNANAGASSIVVKDMTAGAAGNAVPPTSNRGLLVAHSGTSPTQAEVILLSRNVRVRSTSATLMSYVQIKAGAVVDIDWAEFYYLGVNATGQKGVDVEVNTTGATNFSMQFSSVHDTEVGGFNVQVAAVGGTLTALTFSSNTMWNLSTVTGPSAQISNIITATGWTFDSNIFIRNGNSNSWSILDVGGTFTNNTTVGSTGVGLQTNEGGVTLGTFSGNVMHSNGSNGITLSASSGVTGTFGSCTLWRNNGTGITVGTGNDLVFDQITAFGNLNNNILLTTGNNLQFTSLVSNGDTTFATVSGINVNTAGVSNNVIIDNGDFSTVSGIKTAHTNDINVGVVLSVLRAVLRNTKLGAATEVATPSNLSSTAFIASEKHDQTAGNHICWMKNGKVQTDTTIFNTASPSMRMTPTSASLKLEAAPQFQGMKAAVASGASVTIAVYTYKSVIGDGAAYNGNQPRLILKANPAIGIASDTVIVTASVAAGSWAQISGATAAATDDGVMEFVVDCDGTAGWVNVDDWSAA